MALRATGLNLLAGREQVSAALGQNQTAGQVLFVSCGLRALHVDRSIVRRRPGYADTWVRACEAGRSGTMTCSGAYALRVLTTVSVVDAANRRRPCASRSHGKRSVSPQPAASPGSNQSWRSQVRRTRLLCAGDLVGPLLGGAGCMRAAQEQSLPRRPAFDVNAAARLHRVQWCAVVRPRRPMFNHQATATDTEHPKPWTVCTPHAGPVST